MGEGDFILPEMCAGEGDFIQCYGLFESVAAVQRCREAPLVPSLPNQLHANRLHEACLQKVRVLCGYYHGAEVEI